MGGAGAALLFWNRRDNSEEITQVLLLQILPGEVLEVALERLEKNAFKKDEAEDKQSKRVETKCSGVRPQTGSSEGKYSEY